MSQPLNHLTGLALASAFLFGACSGGSNATGVKGTSGDFVVLSTNPANNGRLFLNEPIQIDFSNRVDLASANLNTVSFAVFDGQGNSLSEQPAGTFRVTASPGDASPGRRLEFVPRFPTTDSFDDGGFRPGRRYVVQLIAGDPRRANTLKDETGKPLRSAFSFSYRTADGTSPAELFRDTKQGGPRRSGFSVTPSDPTGVSLNFLGLSAVEVRLEFDQPVNPASTNVPVRIDIDPETRAVGQRGRIFLEYDDPDPARGRNTWIPAEVELERNTLEGSTVVLRPLGILPNNATVRVIVENTLEDMAGESNVADAAYDRIFARFETRELYDPQFDAVVEAFDADNRIDTDAPILEPFAEIGQGFVRANFDFEGANSALDYEPNTREVVLNTDFTQIVPKGAPPINVSGGVFEFRNVTIPSGVTVRGTGTRPMVWLVTGNFVVNGDLTVSGGNGGRVDTLNSANFPTPGGVGVCGGGNGGRGSPNAQGPSERGETGFGPGQAPGNGGAGGRQSCVSSCNRGSAGGGGSYATQGDPFFFLKSAGNNSFAQQKGIGGYGCRGSTGNRTSTLAGGNPGPRPFTDARNDNDFFGSAVDINRRLRIRGELAMPLGGAGGGGGGDRANTCGNDPNWIQQEKGGGGGGGAGVLIVKALGRIEVGPGGTIRAEGGFGGGGEAAGSNSLGGGGGAGSGGLIVLMSGTGITINVKGETYANNDYDFSISADGSTGTQGRFAGPEISGKYPGKGGVSSRGAWDNNPTGGFGGLGIVQLMAPPGEVGANPDSTNTVLDDNITLIRNNQQINGAEKQRFLAWRGFPDETGKFVDDSGNETNIGDDEGDIRPAPLLLPTEFAAKSRVRSIWIDSGASVRRELNAPDGQPRGVVRNPISGRGAGPVFEFAGITDSSSSSREGYVDYVPLANNTIELVRPAILPTPVEVTRIDPNGALDGQPTFSVSVTGNALGQVANRYRHYRAELVDVSGSVVASYRILDHTSSVLQLDPRDGLLPAGIDLQNPNVRLQIRAVFFDLHTGPSQGLGETFVTDGEAAPKSSVKIGFAFHIDPANPKWKDPDKRRFDENRYPNDIEDFFHNFEDPGLQAWLKDKGAAAFLKYDILFNTRFHPTKSGNIDPERGLSPANPRPELRSLVIPFQF